MGTIDCFYVNIFVDERKLVMKEYKLLFTTVSLYAGKKFIHGEINILCNFSGELLLSLCIINDMKKTSS